MNVSFFLKRKHVVALPMLVSFKRYKKAVKKRKKILISLGKEKLFVSGIFCLLSQKKRKKLRSCYLFFWDTSLTKDTRKGYEKSHYVFYFKKPMKRYQQGFAPRMLSLAEHRKGYHKKRKKILTASLCIP